MYVLVLGLDVLGNPFGVIRGLAEGIEDFFYEPYQGIVQGPEEFAEGLAIGFKSLFGHAVGMSHVIDLYCQLQCLEEHFEIRFGL
jgi:vacuolar protein sorting-associated protein 13A/C